MSKDPKDLKIQHFLQKSLEDANRIADLRVEVTMLTEQLDEARNEAMNLRQRLEEYEADEEKTNPDEAN